MIRVRTRFDLTRIWQNRSVGWVKERSDEPTVRIMGIAWLNPSYIDLITATR